MRSSLLMATPTANGAPLAMAPITLSKIVASPESLPRILTVRKVQGGVVVYQHVTLPETIFTIIKGI